MSITLTTDYIVTEDVVKELLNVSGDEARLLINSVSKKFKSYTNRLTILADDITECQRGTGLQVFWLHATPINSFTSVQVLSDGEVDETITSYGYDDSTGRLWLYEDVIPFSASEKNLKVVYNGGWTPGTVPGDIVESALEYMRLEKTRRAGRLGLTSESAQGQTVSFERDGLPKAIQDTWNQYRFLV